VHVTTIDDTTVYTPRYPLMRDGRVYVSVEALVPGDVVRIRRYGYVEDAMPAGDYVGIVLSTWEVPWMDYGDVMGRKLQVVLSGRDGSTYLDEWFSLDGSLLEFVAGYGSGAEVVLVPEVLCAPF
jgi:hypothetical protein